MGAIVLTGCGQSKVAQTAFDAYRIAFVGFPDVPISRTTVTNLPYASIGAKIGKGPRSLLILWRQENQDLHWMSADGVAIVTRRGRVVKTAGLPENMKDTRSVVEDPVHAGLHLAANRKSHTREVDFSEPTRYGLLIDSVFAVVGPRIISIAEIEFDTLLVTERCQVKTLNWTFTNRFWVDPADGFVWRSEQTIARGFPAIAIDILKPAG